MDSDEEADYAAKKKQDFRILKEEDIIQLQRNDIASVCSFLSVSRGAACTLLYRNNWCPTAVYENWFADDAKTPEPVRILGKRKRKSTKQICNICYEEGQMTSAACGHPFCVDCWKTYITTAIHDGAGCLELRCPEPECEADVGLDMVDRLISGEDRDRYYKYLHRSYVEGSRKRKWCPAPGCDFAVELDADECELYNVTCDCRLKFCWKCLEEHHRPADCETVAKWIEKNSSEAENTRWILAYTKPCPKCKRPIQKNRGCNDMTCRKPCRFSFCWLCLAPLSSHKSCNKYKKQKDDEKSIRIKAHRHLRRYSHYYERWHANDTSRTTALVNLDRARDEGVTALSLVQEKVYSEMEFVVDAWNQIVECRSVLKWSYAYGFYFSLENSRNKRTFFEFLQGQAEEALEKLHYCAETEMKEYLCSRRDDFVDFKSKLAHLTSVTRNHFDNLVRALENDLSEVVACRTKKK